MLETGYRDEKDARGCYWVRDIRLTTSLFLFPVCLAYNMLRNALEETEKRARYHCLHHMGFLSLPEFIFNPALALGSSLVFGRNMGESEERLEATFLQLTFLLIS